MGVIREIQERFSELRYPVSSGRAERHVEDPAYLQQQLRTLHVILEDLLARDDVISIAAEVPFRMIGPRRHRFGAPVLNNALLFGDMNIAEALRYLGASIQEIPLDWLLSPEASKEPAPRHPALDRVLPVEQVPAPAQFAVEDEKLRIVRQRGEPLAEDQANVDSARDDLIQRGEKIVEELSRSNCDSRIIESYRELQGKLIDGADIIRVGITNIACAHLTDQFECELPSAVSALMKAQAVGVNMYVAQFPQWQRFAEQAAISALSRDDIPPISTAIDKILEGIERTPAIADPEVPRLLKALRDLINNPSKVSQRALFAAWRTLENLFIGAYSYAKEFIKQTADKSVRGLSTVAATLIVTAVGGALLLSPIAVSLPEGSWIKKATEIIVEELVERGIPLG